MIWALSGIVWTITGATSIAYIISLFSAQLATIIMIFLYYLRPAEKALYPYPIVMVGLIIAMIVVLFYNKPYSLIKNYERKDTKLFLLMQGYLLFNIILFNRWNIQEIYTTYVIPASILFFLISEYAITIKQIRLALLAIGIAALATCMDALYIHFMSDSTSKIWLLYHLGDSNRLISLGWWDNPNKLAYLSNIGLLCFFVAFTLSKNIKRYLLLMPALIFLPTLFLTGSRGALLQLSVSGFILFIRGKKNAGRLIVVASLVFVAATYLAVLSPERQHAQGSADERLDILYYAKDVFKAHPVFGVGFKMFPEYNPYGLVTHNTFAQLFVELGLIGALIFYYMSKQFFGEAYQIGKQTIGKEELSEIHTLSKGIFAISVGAYVYYIFGNQLLDFMCVTILGLLVAVKRAYEIELEKISPLKTPEKRSAH